MKPSILLALGLIATQANAQGKWTSRSPSPTAYSRDDLACAPSRCVAIVGDGGLLATVDGRTWTGIPNVPEGIAWQSIVWANNQFLAMGQFQWGVSLDGIRWEFFQSNPAVQSWGSSGAGWIGNRFLAIGQNDSDLVSDDGRSWMAVPGTDALPNSQKPIFAVGEGKVVVGCHSCATGRSADSGRTWTPSVDTAGDPVGGFRDVLWTGSEFHASSYDRIWKSGDGATWSSDHFELNFYPTRLFLDGTSEYALGYGGLWARRTGSGWTKIDAFDTRWNFSAMGKVGGTLFAIGDPGASLWSSDGTTWNHGTPLVDLHSAIYAENGFFALGDSGTILRSVDGSAWSAIPSPTRANLFATATDGIHAVALGDSGTLVRSIDSAHWTKIEIGASRGLRSVAWDGQRYLAVGDTGSILVSPDGSNWTDRSIKTPANLIQVTSFADKAYVLDSWGRVRAWTDTGWEPRGPAGTNFTLLAGSAADGLVAYDADEHSWYSLDGATWKECDLNYGATYDRIVRTTRRWISIERRSGNVLSNETGMVWGSGGTVLPGIEAVASHGEQIVAVGTGSRIWTSTEIVANSVKRASTKASDLSARVVGGRLVVQARPVGDVEVRIADPDGRTISSRRLNPTGSQNMSLEIPGRRGNLVVLLRQNGVSTTTLVPALGR